MNSQYVPNYPRSTGGCSLHETGAFLLVRWARLNVNLPLSSLLRPSCGIQVPIDQFLRSSILGGLSLTRAGTAEEEREDERASGLAVKDAPRWWLPRVGSTAWLALPVEVEVPTLGVEKAISPSEVERPCEGRMLALALAVDGGVGASGRGGSIQTAVDGVPAEIGIVLFMVLCETGRGTWSTGWATCACLTFGVVVVKVVAAARFPGW